MAKYEAHCENYGKDWHDVDYCQACQAARLKAPQHMILKRIKPGEYQSKDGRVCIKREVSKQTGHADEIVWNVCVDGKWIPFGYENKKEAVKMAEKRLAAYRLAKEGLE